MRLLVLTPEESVFDGQVDGAIVPLPDGWLGIYPGHLPFSARVRPGEILVQVGDRSTVIATIGGILSVEDDAVTLLTGAAKTDTTLERLEHDIGNETRQLAALEVEAERHFDRVLRQVANTFARHRRSRD